MSKLHPQTKGGPTKTSAQSAYVVPRFDPNPTVTKMDTWGSNVAPGELYAIAYADPVAAPILHDAKNTVRGFSWEVQPKNDSLEARAAARVIEDALEEDVWCEIAAQCYWHVYCFGSHIAEHIFWTEGGQPKWEWNLIPSFAINQIWRDSTGLKARSIQQLGDSSLITYNSDEFVHTVNASIPGDLSGMSRLRPVLSYYRLKSLLFKTFAQAEVKAAGFLKLSDESMGQQRDPAEFRRIENAVAAAARGDADYIALPDGMDADVISLARAAMSDPTAVWQYLDGQIRAALNSHLENLGLVGSGSNRALGEVLEEADRQRARNEIQEIEKVVNGPLFERICDDLGIPANYRPRMVISTPDPAPDVDKILERLDRLADIQEDRVLTEDEFDRLKAMAMSGALDEEIL